MAGMAGMGDGPCGAAPAGEHAAQHIGAALAPRSAPHVGDLRQCRPLAPRAPPQVTPRVNGVRGHGICPWREPMA
eukprot:5233573-Pyramimonas_sp.AAC.1